MSCNSMVSGVYIYTVKSDFHVSCYSVESESLIVGSNRISMCRITVLRLNIYLYGQIGFPCVVLQCGVWNLYLYGQPGELVYFLFFVGTGVIRVKVESQFTRSNS